MKKITIIIATVIIAIAAKTQITPQANSNIPNNTLGKFEGTWMWANGIDTVKIFLKKENILLRFPQNSYADFIVGFHIYKHGNDTVESSIGYINTQYSQHHSTILGGNTDGDNILRSNIEDLSKNKKLEELILTLNSAQNQLLWSLNATEGIKYKEIQGFTLPRSLTLIKQ